MESPLSPAEIARRFGISIKTLRVYEQHGLLKPSRTANGSTGAAWRLYGSDQIVRLHQILALKRLGLSLGQIGEVLTRANALHSILTLQERVLARDGERIAHALTLIRRARAQLASGQVLSIDDLAALTQETHMTPRSTAEDLKEILTPFVHKHLTPQELASLKAGQGWASGEAWHSVTQLFQEARALMTSGHATSAAELEFARRFRATTERFRNGEPESLTTLRPKLKAMMAEAQSDPAVSQKLEVLAFVEKALEKLKAHDAASAGEG